MYTYLIIYECHYKKIETPEEIMEQIRSNSDNIKKIKDRKLLEYIYNWIEKQSKYIWYKAWSKNLITKCDLKWEEFINFINKKIQEERSCNEKQYLEINIENIINLDNI